MSFRLLLWCSTLALLSCQPPGGGPDLDREVDSGTHTRSGAALSWAGPEFKAFPVQLQDAAGNQLIFHDTPARIISLVPSATQTILALGAQSSLVARTEFDTDVSLADLPSVGGGLNPSLESLVSLEPDLVIRFSGTSDPDTPDRLDDFGIRHWAVRLDRILDVRIFIADLGSVMGSQQEARTLLAEMDGALESIRSKLEGRPRVRVAYLLGGNPPWVAGPGTFMDELLALAGGENSFSDLEALYGPVSPEEFLVREIDLILAPEGAELLLPSSRIPVERVSPSVELPGPGLAQAARELAGLLHPEAFR